MPGASNPTAFLSWAHRESSWNDDRVEAWRDEVGAFADALLDHGVDALIDLDRESTRGIDWTRFGPREIEKRDWVLAILSPPWRARWEGSNDPHEGAGAVAEADALRGLFARNQQEFRDKLVLITLGSMKDEQMLVPSELYGVQRQTVDSFDLAGMEALLRLLLNQPRRPRREIGPIPTFPVESDRRAVQNIEKQDHRLRVPIGLISEANLLDLGVRRAAVDATQGVSAYIPRPEPTARLTDAIDAAIEQTGPRLVIVTGRSAAGKTRVLYETLAGHARPMLVIAPSTPDDLVHALEVAKRTAAAERSATERPIIVWLEDLEEFIGGPHGLTPARVRGTTSIAGIVVVATTGGKGADVSTERLEELRAPLTDLIEMGAQVSVPPELSPAEADAAAAQGNYSRKARNAFRRRGPGAHFVAGPALEHRYQALNTSDPAARAVLDAALAWRTAGIPNPAPRNALFALWQCSNLVTNVTFTAFENALHTAARPVAHHQVYPLTRHANEGADTWEIHDYLASSVAPARIGASAWEAILTHATGAELVSVGVLALQVENPVRAEAAFRRADERGDATGASNFGILLGRRALLETDPETRAALRRDQEGAYRRGIERGDARSAFGLGLLLNLRATEAAHPVARVALRRDAESAFRLADKWGDDLGAFSLGVMLCERADEEADPEGRAALLSEAEAAFGRADERGHAEGAFNLGVMLGARADEEADPQARAALCHAQEAAYRRADERGDANAAYNLGTLRRRNAGDAAGPELQVALCEGAEAAYRRADERGHAEGAFFLGVMLGERADEEGDPRARAVLRREMEAAYRRADERGDASAAFNLGVMLSRRAILAVDSEARAALLGERQAAYRRADERGHAAGAFNLGVMLGERADEEGDPEARAALLGEQQAAYRRADERGHAAAAFNLGVTLGERADEEGDPQARAALRREKEAAYRRADERGHAAGAFYLGGMLGKRADEEGDPRARAALVHAQEAAFRRAEERGYASAAYFLGVLLDRRADEEADPDVRAALRREEEAAFRRADALGQPAGAFALGVMLGRRALFEADPEVRAALRREEEEAYRRADGRG